MCPLANGRTKKWGRSQAFWTGRSLWTSELDILTYSYSISELVVFFKPSEWTSHIIRLMTYCIYFLTVLTPGTIYLLASRWKNSKITSVVCLYKTSYELRYILIIFKINRPALLVGGWVGRWLYIGWCWKFWNLMTSITVLFFRCGLDLCLRFLWVSYSNLQTQWSLEFLNVYQACVSQFFVCDFLWNYNFLRLHVLLLYQVFELLQTYII